MASKRVTYPVKTNNPSDPDDIRKFKAIEANEIKEAIEDHANNIDALLAALGLNEGTSSIGEFLSLAILQAAYPDGADGSYAIINDGISTPQVSTYNTGTSLWEAAVPENPVIWVANLDALPDTGAVGKLYVALDSGIIYFWDSGDYKSVGPGGPKGDPGVDGNDGDSAYQIAVDNGFVGTEAEWLISLKGEDGETGPKGDTGDAGPKGDTGDAGADGAPGADGNSAYQIAVANGFEGTEAEWLLSLKGEDGADGVGAGTEIITDETPTASLKFDKNYFPDETRVLNLSTGDITLSLSESVTNIVGNSNFFDVIGDNTHKIILGSGFKSNGAIPPELDGAVLLSKRYTFFCMYSSDGIIINVPNFKGQTPVDDDDDVEDIGQNAFLLYAEDLSTANGEEVLLWLDRSTSGKPATATSGKAPIMSSVGEYKSVKFDGATSFMNVDNVPNLGGTDVEASYFVVAKFDDESPAGVPFTLNKALTSNSMNMSPLFYFGGPPRLTFHPADNAGLYVFSAYYEPGIHVYMFNRKGATMDIYMDGAIIMSGIPMSGYNTGDRFTIGALIKQLNPDGKYFFRGDILAVGGFYKKLELTELQTISSSLTTKYGVELRSNYVPSYTSSTDLAIAYEAATIKGLNTSDSVRLLYPLNKGSYTTRDNYKMDFNASGVSYDENAGHPALSFPGTQAKVISSELVIPEGGINHPICVFFVAKYVANGVLQVPVALIFATSPNNNLLWAGRNGNDNLYSYRRVTNTVGGEYGVGVDNQRHIFCYNMKADGTIDIWVDNVKSVSGSNINTTPNELLYNQVLALGNSQQDTAAFNGLLELVHIYDAEKSDAYIQENFDSINAALQVYA